MKPFVFSVQFASEANDFQVTIDRGIMFGNSYSAIAKEIEDKYTKKDASIIDLYIVTIDKETIHLSEESYEKLLNGETI